MLIIVCGLQGTGKTTVARKIAEKTNSILLRSDVIRKELIKKPQYTEEEVQYIYDEMFLRTMRALAEGKNIILDATFNKESNRSRAKRIAEMVNADFKIIEVVCSEEVLKRRIEERSGDESEARFEVYLEYKKLFEPIREERAVIDNSGTLKETDEQLNKYLSSIFYFLPLTSGS